MMVGCDDQIVWDQAEEESEKNVEEFIVEYREAWNESLSTQSFSIVEPYLYPNSQYYHMKRRTHQEYMSQRVVEETLELNVRSVEKSEDGEYRTVVEEKVLKSGGEEGEETRLRMYYLLPFKDQYRVTQMERQELS